jgi:hypothetical protein
MLITRKRKIVGLICLAFAVSAAVVTVLILALSKRTENVTRRGNFSINLKLGPNPSPELLMAADECRALVSKSVLESPAGETDRVTINVTEKNLGDGVLGSAYRTGTDKNLNPEGNFVELGTSIRRSSIVLNGINRPAYVSVLLHEIFHVLGLVCVSASSRKLCDAEKLTYSGPSGVREMNLLRKRCGRAPSQTIKLEDDGGYGTAGVHIEEDEYRHLLMTGYLNSSNFLSRIELGMLEDIGYRVDYSGAADASEVCP